MPCALQLTHQDNQKVSEVGKGNRSKTSVQVNDSRRSSEESGISSFSLRNIDQRCAILTFPTLENDGQWRIIALPLQYFDHNNHFESGSQVNMNGLHLVSSPTINSFKVDGRKTRKGPQPEVTYSAKPLSARSFSGSKMQYQFRDRAVANKLTKLNGVTNNSSCQSSITCNGSSVYMRKGSNATNPSATFNNCSKEEKSSERNSRKKTRKKGKNKKKHLCDVGSTESEGCSECTRGSSASELCGKNDMNHGIVVSCAASPEVSSGCLLKITDFSDSSNGVVASFESPNICTSDMDEVDISESILPSQLQKFSMEHHINKSVICMEYQQVSRFQGGIVGTNLSQMGSVDGIRQKGFSDMHSLVLDSVSVDSSSEENTSARQSVGPFDDDSPKINQSVLPDSGNKKGSFYGQNMLCSISEAHDSATGRKHGLDCNSSDVCTVASGKIGKQFKSVSGTTCKLGTTGNLHGRVGTENSYSVWQRVQRNGVEKCNTDLKKASPVCSPFDVFSKEAASLRKSSNAANETTLSRTDDKKKLKDKVPRKLKRKVSPASKQEKSSYCKKGSYPNKVNLNNHAKAGFQKGEMSDDLTDPNDQRVSQNVSRSRSQLNFTRVGTMKSELVDNLQVSSSSTETSESVCNTVSVLGNQFMENRDGLPKKPCVPLDRPNLHQVQSPVYLTHLTFNGADRTQKEIALVENSKQSSSSGSVLQKWIPVGIKDSRITTSGRSAKSLEHSNGSDAEDWTLKSNFEEKVAPCSQNISSSVITGTMCGIGKHSGHKISSHENESSIKQLNNLNACTNENENKHNGPKFLGDETKEPNSSALAANFNKITRASNDAYRAQMASEAFQMAVGGPIAEFERLLHFSSPVICHSYSSEGCQACLSDQVPGAVLCRHETPSIPLGCLWKWYEKHGSYGLEIRAEDYENPKRLGFDRFEFRAYFVPFLSAVQLFRNSESLSTQNNASVSSPRVSEAWDTGFISRSSAKGKHLIFSVLGPQPHTSEQSSHSQVNDVVGAEPSPVSPNSGLPAKVNDTTSSDRLEPVFEYFESEQPQKRRALYEKIQELVREDVSPQCKMYGDPGYLNSMNMHDLHPRSWYSVAWYPIYRIPDGNLRAAFLTYHSLGHLVRRSSKFDYRSADSIVSPVVGLQSYNAQGECWFQPRHSAGNASSEIQGLIPSEILKERVRTLEETASLMARAVVNKGNQISVNKHPDYEFFLSRQR